MSDDSDNAQSADHRPFREKITDALQWLANTAETPARVALILFNLGCRTTPDLALGHPVELFLAKLYPDVEFYVSGNSVHAHSPDACLGCVDFPCVVRTFIEEFRDGEHKELLI